MPRALPTCRTVIISPEPEPARSTGSAPSAESMDGTTAKPKPRPAAESHSAVKP